MSASPQNITVDPADPRQALDLLNSLVRTMNFNADSHDVIRQSVATLRGCIQIADGCADLMKIRETHMAKLGELARAIQAAVDAFPTNQFAGGYLVSHFNDYVDSIPIPEAQELKLTPHRADEQPEMAGVPS